MTGTTARGGKATQSKKGKAPQKTQTSPARPARGRVSRPAPARGRGRLARDRSSSPEEQSPQGRVSRPASARGRGRPARDRSSSLEKQSPQGRVSRPASARGRARPARHRSSSHEDSPPERRVSRRTTKRGHSSRSSGKTRARDANQGRVSRPNTRTSRRRSHSPLEQERRSKRPRTSRHQDTSSSDEFSSEAPSDYSELDENDLQSPRRPGSIPTEPNTSHVPPKTKKKILKGEYFDLSKLLPTLLDYEESEKVKTDQVKALTFYDWICCFHTFMSIRLEFAPQELQGMLRHCEIVQDLHSQGKDGILYDARFRRKKEQYPFIGWGEYMADVVDGLPRRKFTMPTRPQLRPVSQLAPRPLPGSAPNPNPTPCLKYNSANGCTFRWCRYAHKCRKCGRLGHPAFKCYARAT